MQSIQEPSCQTYGVGTLQTIGQKVIYPLQGYGNSGEMGKKAMKVEEKQQQLAFLNNKQF